jgi:hypothetical protein
MTSSSKELQIIPGVGPSVAKCLVDIGIRAVADLRGEDPQRLYEDLCALRQSRIDRCVLYVFRCAVYFAENEERDEELLRWWNWTDERVAAR